MDSGLGLEGLAPAKTIGAREGLHSDTGSDPLLEGGGTTIDPNGDWASNGDWAAGDWLMNNGSGN